MNAEDSMLRNVEDRMTREQVIGAIVTQITQERAGKEPLTPRQWAVWLGILLDDMEGKL